MAFEREAAIQPILIGDMQVIMEDPEPGTGVRSIRAVVAVRMSNGEIRTRVYDLGPILSGATIAQLQAFLTSLRTLAVAEILPVEPPA